MSHLVKSVGMLGLNKSWWTCFNLKEKEDHLYNGVDVDGHQDSIQSNFEVTIQV